MTERFFYGLLGGLIHALFVPLLALVVGMVADQSGNHELARHMQSALAGSMSMILLGCLLLLALLVRVSWRR